MFTGLVEGTGRIHSVTLAAGSTRITVDAPEVAARLRTGDSIAVSGVCLTAVGITARQFSADLAGETVARTTLADLEPGSVVNLELPTPAGSPLGGHVVQGHVDGTGTLLALTAMTPAAPTTDWRLRLQVPPELVPYVIPQGSIAVEGISLTVAAVEGHEVEIAIIPHTYAATHLHTLSPGARLNIETDVLARYAGRAEKQRPPRAELTEASMLSNGY